MNRHRLLAIQLEAEQQELLDRQPSADLLTHHEPFFAPTRQSLLVEMQLEGLVLLILAVGIISFFMNHWS